MGSKNKIIAFNYFGGKYQHLEWILNRLPETRTYVEVFGGSGVVLLNRKPSKIDDGTLLYCDPPYTHDTRCNNNEYAYEMTDEDHKEFLTFSVNAKSKVAISGYDNPLYSEYLKNFYKSVAKEKRNTLFHSARREVLWTNYNPQEIHHSLFNNNHKEFVHGKT